MADTLNFFSEADKAVIKHPYEKGYTVHKIRKDNPEKHWDKTSVKSLIKRTEAFGTMDRQRLWPCANSNSSYKWRSVVANDLFSSRSSRASSATKDVPKELKISKFSAQRMIKSKGQKNTRKRRVKRATCVLKKFETNLLMIEHAVFQDESEFHLQVSISSQNGLKVIFHCKFQ